MPSQRGRPSGPTQTTTQVFLKHFQLEFSEVGEAMYARSSPNAVYDLLGEDGQHTLCGLTVAPIVSDRPARTSALHLTTNQPVGAELCADCARIETAPAE